MTTVDVLDFRRRGLLMLMSAFVISLSACTGRMVDTAEQPTVQPSQYRQLTGVLTRRGPQLEAWWGIRAQDGKLWRLLPANAFIQEEFQRLNNQSVQIKGKPLGDADSGALQADFPLLQATQIVVQPL
jgi:hypothetical protein